MTFDNPSGQRDGETESAALLIEGDTTIGAGILKNALFGNRDDGRPALTRVNQTVHDNSPRRRQFANDSAQDSRERRFESSSVALNRCAFRWSMQLDTDLKLPALFHLVDDTLDQGKEVEGFVNQLDDVGVQLLDLAQLGDYRNEALAGSLRLINHLALPVPERFPIALQHAQVAPDHVGWRAQFVHEQG